MAFTIADLGFDLSGESVNRTNLKILMRILGSLESKTYGMISKESEEFEDRLYSLNMKNQNDVENLLNDVNKSLNRLLGYMTENYDETLASCKDLLVRRDALLKQWDNKLPDDVYDNLLSMNIPSNSTFTVRSIVDLYAFHDYLATDIAVILAAISVGFMDAYVNPPPKTPKSKKVLPKAKSSEKVVQLFKK